MMTAASPNLPGVASSRWRRLTRLWMNDGGTAPAQCRNVRYRRVSPIPVRPGEGFLTERAAGIYPVRREQVFMPEAV
jgi:hypothetical protein